MGIVSIWLCQRSALYPGEKLLEAVMRRWVIRVFADLFVIHLGVILHRKRYCRDAMMSSWVLRLNNREQERDFARDVLKTWFQQSCTKCCNDGIPIHVKADGTRHMDYFGTQFEDFAFFITVFLTLSRCAKRSLNLPPFSYFVFTVRLQWSSNITLIWLHFPSA